MVMVIAGWEPTEYAWASACAALLSGGFRVYEDQRCTVGSRVRSQDRFTVLRCIADNYRLDAADIAALTGITHNRVGSIVWGLAEVGLISKNGPRGLYTYSITAHGREVLSHGD